MRNCNNRRLEGNELRDGITDAIWISGGSSNTVCGNTLTDIRSDEGASLRWRTPRTTT